MVTRVGGNHSDSVLNFDPNNVELGLAQISSVYSFTEMVEAIGNH